MTVARIPADLDQDAVDALQAGVAQPGVFYVTFGQKYRSEPHPAWINADPDGVLVVLYTPDLDEPASPVPCAHCGLRVVAAERGTWVHEDGHVACYGYEQTGGSVATPRTATDANGRLLTDARERARQAVYAWLGGLYAFDYDSVAPEHNPRGVLGVLDLRA
jgi:hypothetical protein